MPGHRLSKKKVLVRMTGGLGNQLFQIAFAHNLAITRGRLPILDISFYANPGVAAWANDFRRELEIEPARFGFDCVTNPSLERSLRYLRGTRLRLVESYPGENLIEKVEPWTISVSGFHQRADTALNALPLLTKVVDFERARLSNLEDEPFVAVHARLGDYLNPRTAGFHGVTDPRWLLDRGQDLLSSTSASKIVVFTDSPLEFLRLTSENEGPLLQIDRSLTSWEALLKLSQASGFVISNSTLSWWSAFIATEIDRRPVPVLAPRPWFASESQIEQVLFPDGWKIVPRSLLATGES